ncbi:hypothetical protein [Mucilaginibacter sp.]
MKPYSEREVHKRRKLFRKRLRAGKGYSDYESTARPVRSRLSRGAILLMVIVIAAVFAIAIKTNFGVPKKPDGCFIINRNGEKEFRPCNQ